MSRVTGALLCLLLVAGLAACGRRETNQPPPPTAPAGAPYPAPAVSSDQLPAYPYPLPTPSATSAPTLPYPAPTMPPIPGQATAPLAVGVFNLQVSPDGRYAIYNGDAEGDRSFVLFSLPLDGGAPVALSAAPSPPEMLFSFAISPDSASVVYQTLGGEVLRAPIAGGPSRSLLPAAAEFVLSPDGQWVVSLGVDGALRSAPLAGGAPVQLGDRLSHSEGYAVAPDSSRVLFIRSTEGGALSQEAALLSVPIAGGQPTLLSPAQQQGLRVTRFALSPNGRRVVFGIHEASTTQGVSLLSAPLDGSSGPTVLWDAGQGGPASDFFELSPDGQLVLFTAGPLGAGAELFAAPVEGGPATSLVGPLDGRLGLDPLMVGDHVLYAARGPEERSEELHSVPRGGGASLRLSGPRPFAGGRLWLQGAPAVGRVVFAADLDAPGVVGLYSAPAAGGPATPLSVGLPAGASVELFALSADERLAVFGIFAGSRASLAAVYAARLDGSATWQVLGGGGIVEFHLLPDGRLLYQANRDRDGSTELHLAPLGGP